MSALECNWKSLLQNDSKLSAVRVEVENIWPIIIGSNVYNKFGINLYSNIDLTHKRKKNFENKITVRRHSVRLALLHPPSMKETRPKKKKKNNTVTKPVGQVLKNNDDNSDIFDFSNIDIEDLVSQITNYVESGYFDETSNLLTDDVDMDIELPSLCNSNTQSVQKSHTNCDSGTDVLMVSSIQNISNVTQQKDVQKSKQNIGKSHQCNDIALSRAESQVSSYGNENIDNSLRRNNGNNATIKPNKRTPKKKLHSNKRKGQELFIQSYDMNCGVVNRKALNFKIPKKKIEESSSINSTPPQNIIFNMPPPVLGPFCDQDAIDDNSKNTMMMNIFERPCFTFLTNSECGSFCTYNHLLPRPHVIGQRIKNCSNEFIQFIYSTFVRKTLMSYMMYYHTLCNMFIERRLIYPLLSTTTDCEVMSHEHNFSIIFYGLIQCGLTWDHAMELMFIQCNRSSNSIGKLLEIIVSLNVHNFPRTITMLHNFMSNTLTPIHLNGILINNILQQAYTGTASETLHNFCTKIVAISYKRCNY